MALVVAHVPENSLQQGNILIDTITSTENQRIIWLGEQARYSSVSEIFAFN